MSKKEVLTQVYPDEIVFIFEKKREKELKRYMGYLNQIMAVSAGFGGGESAKEYVQDVVDRVKELNGDDKNNKGQEEDKISNLHERKKELEEKENLTAKEKEKLKDINEQIKIKMRKQLDRLKGML